jgi:hypothetical protein
VESEAIIPGMDDLKLKQGDLKMKQCPKCQSVYPDDSLRFCARDGGELVHLGEHETIFPSLPISPSEIILLNGDQFSPTSSGGFFQSPTVQIPTSGSEVDAVQLGKMILSAMVLCCEQAGSIYLQLGPAPKLTFRPHQLYLNAGPTNIRWQPGSLEDRLCGMLSQTETTPLTKLVYALWQRNFAHLDDKRAISASWKHASTLVLQGLAARNLIKADSKFKNCEVSTSLTAIPAEHTTTPIKRLFDQTVTGRQPFWAALQADIQLAVTHRGQKSGSLIDFSGMK